MSTYYIKARRTPLWWVMRQYRCKEGSKVDLATDENRFFRRGEPRDYTYGILERLLRDKPISVWRLNIAINACNKRFNSRYDHIYGAGVCRLDKYGTIRADIEAFDLRGIVDFVDCVVKRREKAASYAEKKFMPIDLAETYVVAAEVKGILSNASKRDIERKNRER